jgi:hypothetical protein
MLAEIEDFTEGFNQPTYRGCGSTASGLRPGPAETGGPGIAGLMPSGYTEKRPCGSGCANAIVVAGIGLCSAARNAVAGEAVRAIGLRPHHPEDLLQCHDPGTEGVAIVLDDLG